MGVMGAFIFAAQMINFPVGNGTSSHLVGGALLSFTLGTGRGIHRYDRDSGHPGFGFSGRRGVALGANVFNMAIAGVFVGYLPYVLLRGRKSGSSSAPTLSLFISALLALGELALSGYVCPRAMLFLLWLCSPFQP